jgi:hypothetical protein
MIGSSEQLIEKILDAHQALGLDRFLGQIDWGGLPEPRRRLQPPLRRTRRHHTRPRPNRRRPPVGLGRADIAAFTAAQVDNDTYANAAPAISN